MSFDDEEYEEYSTSNNNMNSTTIGEVGEGFLLISGSSVLILINVILLKILFLKFVQNDELVLINKYQLFYHQINRNDNNNQYGDVFIDKIVELDGDMSFNGDFYHFEDEKGNGVIVKLDSKGDLYKICAEQCNCHVECQYNDDCNEWFICRDYVCIEDNTLQNRRKKETESHLFKERKIAQVVITAPLLTCIFGVFSLASLAVEYGEKYFIEECEKECPTTSKDFSVIDINPEKIQNKKSGIYHCEGTCILDSQKFQSMCKQRIDETNEKLAHNFQKYDVTSHSTSLVEIFMLYNVFEISVECESTVIKGEFIADDMEMAAQQFALQLKNQCEVMEYIWNYNIHDEFGNQFYSEIHDYGVFQSCTLKPPSIKCTEGTEGIGHQLKES